VPGTFDATKHPRGGPKNRGEFASKGGAGREAAAPASAGPGRSILGVADELEARMGSMDPATAAKAKDLAGKLRAKASTAGIVGAEAGKAKFVGETVGKAEQVYADGIERKVARAVGGKQVGGSAESTGEAKQSHGDPLDVALEGHAVEVKTLLKGGKRNISVHDDALLRKVEYAKRTGDVYHTVAVDHRDRYGGGQYADGYSGHEVYYKRGSGPYALSKMHPVGSAAELRRLIAAPDSELPEAARGSLPGGKQLVKLRESAERAHASRLRKDRARKARIKAVKESAGRQKAA
jgi:hypothetical protein